jgi:AhpD family alkylhydroperoxidase
MEAIKALNAATEEGGLAQTRLGLVHLRASQINGCGVCLESGTRHLVRAGEKDQRIFCVAAWRDKHRAGIRPDLNFAKGRLRAVHCQAHADVVSPSVIGRLIVTNLVRQEGAATALPAYRLTTAAVRPCSG